MAAEESTKRNKRSVARHLWVLLKAFYVSEGKRRARVLLILLLVLALSAAGVQVLMSYAGRDLFTAISNRNEGGYWNSIWWYVAAIGLAVPVGVFYRYAEERLALLWRQWMTHTLVKRYFHNRAYYHLRGVEEVDNPDQRISEDVKNFTSMSLSFMLIMLNSTITLVAFTGVLWSISSSLTMVLMGYAVGGTAVSILIGRRLVGLHYFQYQKEADFRYGIIRVRDNAESIAFYRGEKREHRDLVSRFSEVVRNMADVIGWNRNLAFFTTSYNYAATLIPTLIVAPMFMRGEVEFGAVTQAGGVFAQVLASLSLIITQFERLSTYAAGVARIGGLWERLDPADGEDIRDSTPEEILVEEVKRGLILEDLTVVTPGGKKHLVDDLNLTLKPKESVLIMGASGTGKSSVLRTIAGLWQTGSGSVTRPALKDMMFLPQKPYMMQASLRENLLYPNPDSSVEDAALIKALESVNLAHLVERVDGDLGASMDWTNILSLGEQQRLSFARLVLKLPPLAFLDEATSALDEPNEDQLYQWLRESGVAYVSVGHRSTLKKHHQRLLVLNKDEPYELTQLSDEGGLARSS